MFADRNVEEFGREDLERLTGLDVIACQVAAPGACGYHGGVFLITSDKRILFTCYLEPSDYSGHYKYTPEEDLPIVFPDYDSLEVNKRDWHEQDLGMGNTLYVRRDYLEAYFRAANELLAADRERILYSCWIDALLEAIEPGHNAELIRSIKKEADARDALRQHITELQHETESQIITEITRDNIFSIEPESILIWRCSNVAEGMDKEGHLFRYKYGSYKIPIKGGVPLLIRPIFSWEHSTRHYGPQWDERNLPGYTLLIRSDYLDQFDELIQLFFEKFCSHNCFGIIKHIRGAE